MNHHDETKIIELHAQAIVKMLADAHLSVLAGNLVLQRAQQLVSLSPIVPARQSCIVPADKKN